MSLRTRPWRAFGTWLPRPLRRLVTYLKEASQAAGGTTQTHQHATSARERAALAKRRELAAHARAMELHEQAAELQERLGHPDRAANARAHADHATELQVLALEEQREQEGSAGRRG
jgi:hypothetical protein